MNKTQIYYKVKEEEERGKSLVEEKKKKDRPVSSAPVLIGPPAVIGSHIRRTHTHTHERRGEGETTTTHGS